MPKTSNIAKIETVKKVTKRTISLSQALSLSPKSQKVLAGTDESGNELYVEVVLSKNTLNKSGDLFLLKEVAERDGKKISIDKLMDFVPAKELSNNGLSNYLTMKSAYDIYSSAFDKDGK
jgi:hypothetical protein